MSDGVEHCPAKDWRLKKQRYKLVGERFLHSDRIDLIGRPVDLGYIPGETEDEAQSINVTEAMGALAIANDLVESGD